jgi:hypothetical protein
MIRLQTLLTALALLALAVVVGYARDRLDGHLATVGSLLAHGRPLGVERPFRHVDARALAAH